MDRGEVRPCMMQLPDRTPAGENPPGTEQKLKYVVALQGGPQFANVNDVAVVVCSTLRTRRQPRSFEVLIGTNQGFDHDTIIDCRWVFTVQQRHLRAAIHPRLSDDIMRQVSEALTVGLQL